MDWQQNALHNDTKLLLLKLQVGTLLLLLLYHSYATAAAAAFAAAAAAAATTTNATTATFADVTTAITCIYVPAAVTNIATLSTHKFQVAKNNRKKISPIKAPDQFRILPNEKFMSFGGHPIRLGWRNSKILVRGPNKNRSLVVKCFVC